MDRVESNYLDDETDNIQEPGLNRDQIKNFIRRSQGSSEAVIDEDLRLRQDLYIRLADEYYNVINPGGGEADDIAIRLDKENRFIQSVKEIVQETGELQPFETRILSHDFVAMYGLIVEGELDRMYEQYVDEVVAHGWDAPVDPEEID